MQNSIILITGGTGTFGRAFLKRILTYSPREIRIFSRDEAKHYVMMQEFKKYNNIKFIIGDIRDKSTVDAAMKNVNYVFHAAAMKQVPICELNPIEAMKTNIQGSDNVLTSAITHGVKKIVCLSTDKAVYPISTMGATKLCMEKLALQKAMNQNETKICITRFCNLISSNGSVVPLFINQIQNNLPLTVTNPDMVRFIMSVNDAIDLVEFAFKYGEHGKIYIKNSSPCILSDLIQAIKIYMKVDDNYPVIIIGSRPGEKQIELLFTNEEAQCLEITNSYIAISNIYTNNNFQYNNYLTITDIVNMLQEMEEKT